MNTSNILIGNDIFFNFFEVPYNELDPEKKYVKKIKEEVIHGFITREVFDKTEVKEILSAINLISEKDMFEVTTGRVYPMPFATITSEDEKLRNYVNKAEDFRRIANKSEVIDKMLNRLDHFFKTIGQGFDCSIPFIKNTNVQCAPGNFRFFSPNRDGLFVHCGYLFQKQAPYYYSVVEPMALDKQMSYFLLLQNGESGGELTIYDLLWTQANNKDDIEKNDYVISVNGEKIFVKDLRHFYIKPQPGDILVFSGGPIWHRVENITGEKERITFGGFMNFTPDDMGVRYWG